MMEALPDDAQVCNCNGVTKGKILSVVQGGCRTLKSLCDATRAGTGCGSCKSQVQALLEIAAGDQIADDPAAHYYVPGVPLAKPELIAAIREQPPAQRLRRVRRAGRRHRGSRQQGRTRVAAEDDLGPRVRRSARRALHQRSRPRQHPEGSHLQRRAPHLRRRDVTPPNCAASPTWPIATTCR